jgi:hypothetical protein
MNQTITWFIIKTEGGFCQIQVTDGTKPPISLEVWGPFDSQEQAIAARIGLIRAGKCQPQ